MDFEYVKVIKSDLDDIDEAVSFGEIVKRY